MSQRLRSFSCVSEVFICQTCAKNIRVILSPNWGLKDREAGALRTRRNALTVRGPQDWQGHGKLPISGATVCAVIKMSVKGDGGKAQYKELRELLGLTSTALVSGNTSCPVKTDRMGARVESCEESSLERKAHTIEHLVLK